MREENIYKYLGIEVTLVVNLQQSLKALELDTLRLED